MLINYEHLKTKIISKGYLAKDDILDIEFHPLEELLLKFYKYSTECIAKYTVPFNLKETFFLYHSSRLQNAVAIGEKDCNIILVTNGLFVKLHEKFLSENTSFPHLFKNYPSFKEHKHRIGLLMFETATIFTLFHEFAHLIQNKNIQFTTDEFNNDFESFDQYCHLKEYDSDLCGCNFVINVVEQFLEDHIEEFSTEEDKINIHCLSLTSIIVVMLLFLNNFEFNKIDKRLYIKEMLHPHPSVRINYIIEHYLYNLEKVCGLPVNIQ